MKINMLISNFKAKKVKGRYPSKTLQNIEIEGHMDDAEFIDKIHDYLRENHAGYSLQSYCLSIEEEAIL